MKHKFILILAGLLIVAPSLVNGYNPTNEELRSSIFDYIGTQSQRQQYQDIIDTQNSSYQQLFNNYNQYTNNLDRELDLKLKELELQREAEERAQSWEKEKQIIDQQLELIRQMNELEAQRKAFETEKNSEDLVQYMQGVADQIVKDRESEENSEIKNITNERIKPPREIKKFQYEEKRSLEDIFNDKESTLLVFEPPVVEEVESQEPRKNIFKRIWSKFVSFF